MSYEYLSTGSNEYPTPVNLFKSIEDYFGKFDIDLSATKENTKCDIFFTKEQDSLKQDWNYNMCWRNPPYSKDLQPLFIEKAYHTNIKYNNTIVILIPFRADTRPHPPIHPTEKPVDLLIDLLETYTKENDLILDFTGGSFSMGVACVKSNRQFVGIELDEKYFNIGVDRIRGEN